MSTIKIFSSLHDFGMISVIVDSKPFKDQVSFGFDSTLLLRTMLWCYFVPHPPKEQWLTLIVSVIAQGGTFSYVLYDSSSSIRLTWFGQLNESGSCMSWSQLSHTSVSVSFPSAEVWKDPPFADPNRVLTFLQKFHREMKSGFP